MSPLASRNDEMTSREGTPSSNMGLNVDPDWGAVPLSATPTPTGTPALGQKDFDRRIKRKYANRSYFYILELIISIVEIVCDFNLI